MLIVHPHFHRRRTGITSHVDAIVPALNAVAEARALGTALGDTTPRIALPELLERAKSADVIWHAHRNLELLAGLQLRAVRPRVRVLMTRHSTEPASRYTRWLAGRADARIALTDEVAAALGLLADVVPHGVDVQRFAPPGNRAQAAAAVGLGSKRAIGVIGRIRPEKGQGDFIEAVAPLLAEHVDWEAFLVGLAKPADARSLNLAHASELGIRIPGPRQNIVLWYQATSILVHPSHREAFSLALLEGMASGCCVVATALPHHPRIIEHGRNGFLYPPGDVTALRTILEGLMADPQRAEAIGLAAAQTMRERFSVEHEAKALGTIYARTLASKPAG